MENYRKNLNDIGFQMFTPSEELQPSIQCYWSIYLKENLLLPRTEKIISDGGMGIVFNFGDKFSIKIGERTSTDTAGYFVTGPTRKATHLRFDEKIYAIGIRFNPGGAYPFFQEDISNFTDRIIPGFENENFKINNLYLKLKNADSLIEKITELDRYLLKTPRRSDALPSLWMIQVINIIQQHKGSMKINDLSNCLKLTRRHFDRKFKKEVGLLPKQFSSIVRIEKSRSMIQSLKFNSLTEVSMEHDYFDQAHFIREFKAFVEETPKEYLQKKKRMSLL